MKKMGKLALLLAIVALAFTMVGCDDWLLEMEYYTVDVSGRMIDAKDTTESTGKGLTETTVKLLNESGTQIASTTTTSTGYFSFSGLEPGSYTITGTKDTSENTAYAFLPYEFEVASTSNITGF